LSIFLPVKARCGKCDTVVQADLAASVNADRRPDLRQAIIDGTFQSLACPSCGTQVRLPAHLTYIDMARGQWILVERAEQIMQWRDVEAEALALYDQAFGREAPEIQQSLGQAMVPRLVFGWTALREKLLAKEFGLEDVLLELLKISVLRNVPAPPMSDTTELRLIDVEGSGMRLRWLDATTEEGIADLPLDREIYNDLAGNLSPWAELKGELEAGLFVDMKRILIN
jgi:CpXC protein